MKIEIHLRDTMPNGKRINQRRACRLESCRVYREAGDGLRLNNIAHLALQWFQAAALCFINDDPEQAKQTGTLANEERLQKYCADIDGGKAQ